MRVDLYIHWPDFDSKLDAILAAVTRQGAQMAATLDDVKAQVTATTDAEQAAIVLLTALHAQLVAAQAANDPAALQAVIDQLGASKDALSAAIVANTVSA